jgi:ABC-2 type transport system ATP-binding protein
MDSKLIVETYNLTKVYQKKTAVDNVNLHIHEGDIYGLVGKNGAGKTTLIRLLTGVISPTKGSYSLFGKTSQRDLLKARKNIAAMIETPALYLNMTAHDNMKTRCILLGINDESVVNNRLNEVGLKDVVHSKKKAADFSLGMRQRLGIAMSLLGSPKLLILDEPTNGLDPEGIKEMRELLIKINKESHVTMIISSHILSELGKFATTYGFMDNGKLINEISSEELNKSTRKSLSFVVDDADKCYQYLKTYYKDIEAEKVGSTIKLYGLDDVSKILNGIYRETNFKISDIREEANSLEDYFIKLIGGLK